MSQRSDVDGKPIGYIACFKQLPDGTYCRKPKGHTGACVALPKERANVKRKTWPWRERDEGEGHD